MKKWFSILGVIGLTATSTTTLISCEKPNNKNISCEKQDNGNWKQQCSNDKPFNTVDNKYYYIIVWRGTSNSKWNINGFDNWQNDNLQGIGLINKYRLYRTLNSLEIKQEPNKIISNWNNDNGTYFKSFYCWDGTDKPDIPEIDNNTGKIIELALCIYKR